MSPKESFHSSALIGVVVCGTEHDRQFVSTAYLQAIWEAGGIPVVLPSCDMPDFAKAAKKYLRLCHGFLFCGGGDIHPLLMGEEPLPRLGATDLSLDLFQLSFIRRILHHSDKPVLGICRGMQVLNVALGGTIYQDLSYLPDSAADPETSLTCPLIAHMQSSALRSDFAHSIQIQPNSRLHDLLGPSAFVNSFHHQAIHRLAPDVTACAHAPDGVIEAIELQGMPFVLGVQWHPEAMAASSSKMSRIFRAFCDAARGI